MKEISIKTNSDGWADIEKVNADIPIRLEIKLKKAVKELDKKLREIDKNSAHL